MELMIERKENSMETNLREMEKVENRKSEGKNWWVELRKAQQRHADAEETLAILKNLEKQLETENKLRFNGQVIGGGTWRGTSDLSATNSDLSITNLC